MKNITFEQVVLFLWSKKINILLASLVSALIFFSGSYFFQDKYMSKTTLVSSNTQFSPNSGGLSSIASFAGIGVPSMADPKILEAIKTIQSFQFFQKLSLRENFQINIIAAKSWDFETQEIIYDTSSLVVEGDKRIPLAHPQLIHQEFINNLEMKFDSDGGFLEMSYEHYSPIFAAEVLNHITIKINEHFRNQDMLKAKKSVDYLYTQLAQTNLSEVRESLSNIVESQLENLMLAEASEDDYLFKVIDSAQVPIFSSSFGKAVVIIFGLFSGIVLSFLFYLTLFYYRNSFKDLS